MQRRIEIEEVNRTRKTRAACRTRGRYRAHSNVSGEPGRYDPSSPSRTRIDRVSSSHLARRRTRKPASKDHSCTTPSPGICGSSLDRSCTPAKRTVDLSRFWSRCSWQARVVALITVFGVTGCLTATASTFSVQQENVGLGVHAARFEVVNPCVAGDLTIPDGTLSTNPGNAPCQRLVAADVDVVSGAVRLAAGEVVEIRDGFSVASGATLEVTVGDRVRGAVWLRDESPDAETVYAVRFAIDTDGLDFGSGADAFEHFVAYDGEGNREFAIGLTWNSELGEIRLWSEAVENDGTVRTTRGACELTLAGGWQAVEALWRASSSEDGDLVVTVDGLQAQSLAGDCLLISGGLDNGAGEISAIEWGAGRISAGDLGTLDVDDFDSRKSGPIGARSDVVISQLWGAGGNTGAPYTNDFIELFNPGSAPVSLSGRSLQYASASGTSWQLTPLPDTVLAPGQYFLVQQAGGTNGIALPTPDAVGTIAMSSSQGKVALVDSTEALSEACPVSDIVDLVGYGGADCFEGGGAAPALGSSDAALRAGDGCGDADDNASDFATGAPAPRNVGTETASCSSEVVFADGFEWGDASRWSAAPTGPSVAVTGVDYPVIAHGGRLVITGVGLASATEVSIGGVIHADLSGITETSITVDAVSDAVPVGPQTVTVTTPDGSSDPFEVTVIHLMISEVESDSPGADVREYYELDIGFSSQVRLDGYVLVHYNGAIGNPVIHTFDLDAGGAATSPDGLFLIAETALPATPQILDSFSIQSGEDAAAIYQFPGPVDEFPSDYATAGNEGLIDAVIWQTGSDSDAITLYPLLAAGGVIDEGSTTAARETVSIQRCSRSAALRDGNSFSLDVPSPGLPNPGCGTPAILSTCAISFDAGCPDSNPGLCGAIFHSHGASGTCHDMGEPLCAANGDSYHTLADDERIDIFLLGTVDSLDAFLAPYLGSNVTMRFFQLDGTEVGSPLTVSGDCRTAAPPPSTRGDLGAGGVRRIQITGDGDVAVDELIINPSQLPLTVYER